MARTVPTTEPSILVAGDSWSWTKSLSEFPPSEGWALGYSIRGASTLLDTDVVVSTVGSLFSIVVDKVKTAALVAGAYQWQSYVTKAAERYTVETGIISVLPSLSGFTGSQGQNHIERTYALLEAAIEGRITKDYQNYSINGRAISKIDIKELVRLRSIYGAKLARLNNPGQLSTPVLAVMSVPDGSLSSAMPEVLPPWFKFAQNS